MTEPARHLQVVEVDEHGELQTVHETCPGCAERDAEIAGLNTDIRAWRARYSSLKTDKDAAARADSAWPKAVELFNYWRDRCDHPKAKFTSDRFYLLEPFLREDGEAACRRAIDGAAFDPFITKRKNGSEKRHDGFDLIFRSREKMEEFQARKPLPDHVEMLSVELLPHERNLACYAPDGAWRTDE